MASGALGNHQHLEQEGEPETPLAPTASWRAASGALGNHQHLEQEGEPETPLARTASWRAASRLLGLLDSAYGVQARLKKVLVPSLRHWTDGWGDLSLVEKIYSEVHENLELHRQQGPQRYAALVSIHSHSSCADGNTLLEGSFRSPLRSGMPEESAMVPFQAWLPPGRPRAVVVLCPGTGDETFLYRRKALVEPLLPHGVACLLPTMPFYGPRRQHGQRLFYLKTFISVLVQCTSGSLEANVLLDWARVQYPDALLGVAGMSHGAGTATSVALNVHHDLAVVPLLIPTSPAVLATGSLQYDLAIDALGASPSHRGAPSWEDVRSVVVDTLEESLGPDIAGRVTPPPLGTFARCVVIAAAADDGMVLPEWSRNAITRVKESMDPDSEMHWVPGGHVSSFVFARWLFPKLVLRSLERLEWAKTGAVVAGLSRL